MTKSSSVVITLLIYPVKDHLGTGENYNAVLSDGDVISDEIGIGITPHEAIANLMYLVSSDLNEIIQDQCAGKIE